MSPDRWIDLRVDEHPDPIGELGRILELWRLYFDRPTPDELVPLDAALAAEIRGYLERFDAGPGARTATLYALMSTEALRLGKTPKATVAPIERDRDAGRPVIGEPRPLPVGWDSSWHEALIDWMGVENLEERIAAEGWIDPRVLALLRERASPPRRPRV